MSQSYEHIGEEDSLIKGWSTVPQKKWFLPVVALFLVLVAVGIIVGLLHGVNPPQSNMGVSSGSYYATKAGMEIMELGGNAFDAAIAVQAVLTLTEPWASGLGGISVFTLYNNLNKKSFYLDGGGEQPSELNITVKKDMGGLSVAVPGTPDALDRLYKDFCTLPLKTLLAPAIRLTTFPATSALYLDINGSYYREGSILRNYDLANTFELIIERDSFDIFQEGVLANAIIQTVVDTNINPGAMTAEDLKLFKAVYREPVIMNFAPNSKYTLIGPNYPTNGGQFIGLGLNILNELEIDKSTMKWGTKESLKTILDILTITYQDAAWTYRGDPDWDDFLLTAMKELLNPEYAKSRAKLINAAYALKNVSSGLLPNAKIPKGWTTTREETWKKMRFPMTQHYSVVDKDGSIVSCTSTIGNFWGSGMVVPGRGFLLNDLVGGETRPGRRLRRTALYPFNETMGGYRGGFPMCPIIILNDGYPHLALGTPGSEFIPGNTFTTLLNNVLFDMPLKDAVSFPRYNSLNFNGTWIVESELFNNTELINELSKYDIYVRAMSQNDAGAIGNVNMIKKYKDGRVEAVADQRRQGYADIGRGG